MIVLSLFNTFLPAVAIAAAVWLGLRVFRVNAATRFWAWWAVLASLVAMLLWPAAAPLAATSAAYVPAAPVQVEPRVDWLMWGIGAWAVFAAYRLVRIAVSYVYLRGLIRRASLSESEQFDALRAGCGVGRRARLLVSEEVASPIAVGYLRPAVLLPDGLLTNLTPAEFEHVLLHELAHIARRDDWTKLAARLANAVLGLHPVAAFALARIEKERELACDDWVVAATGNARAYAASLARVFELSRGGPEMLASGMTDAPLAERIERLIRAGATFVRRVSMKVPLLIAFAAIGILSQAPAYVAFAQEAPEQNIPAPEAPALIPPKPAPERVAPTPPAPASTAPDPYRRMVDQCIGNGPGCPASRPVTWDCGSDPRGVCFASIGSGMLQLIRIGSGSLAAQTAARTTPAFGELMEKIREQRRALNNKAGEVETLQRAYDEEVRKLQELIQSFESSQE